MGFQGRDLYSTNTLFGTPVAEGSNRTCVYTWFAPKNARFTPVSRAASAASNISFDQYSSWPTERNALWFFSSPPLTCVSISLEYVTSYPERSSHRTRLMSQRMKAPKPWSAIGRSNDTFTADVFPETVFAP